MDNVNKQRPFSSPQPDVVIPEVPLTAFVLQQADRCRDKPALIDGSSGRTLTFGVLSDAIHRLAGGLHATGIGPGKVVAIIAPNVPEYAVVFHAVAVCGGTVTTVNPTYHTAEIRQQLIDSAAVLVVTIADLTEHTKAAIAGTSVREIISIGDAEGYRSLQALECDAIAQVALDVHQHLVVLPYSSGTTGMPKGVMLSHFNLVANLTQTNAMVQYADEEVALAVLPFFHIYGMQVLMGSLLSEGHTIVTMPRFDMEQALALIQQHRVTQFYAVPPIVLGFAKHPAVDTFDISSLRKVFCGAAPLGDTLEAEARERIGCPIIQGYGMTEMSPISHCALGVTSRPGSCGLTVPNTRSRIVNADGIDQGVDEIGELWVKGPQVMLGYLNNAEATAETLTEDGWLRTGDIGRIDADGYLFIVDRLKELIKYKGFQVPPAELEALIVSHPAVADVAVVGIPDDEAGELPKAFVCLRADAVATADEIKTFVAGHVASYKQVREVEFIESIPKSASGKILRRQLRDKA